MADHRYRVHRDLPTRMAATVGLIVLIASTLLGLVVGVIASDAILEREATGQLAQASRLDRLLGEDLIERRRDVELLALTLTEVDLGDDLPPEREQALQAGLERLLDGPTTLSWLGVLDADGTVRHTTALHEVGEDLGDLSWFVSGLDAPNITGVHAGDPPTHVAADGGGRAIRVVDLSAPIRAADGTSIGVVAAHLPASWLEDRATQVLAIDGADDTELYLLDGQGGVLLAFSSPTRPDDGVGTTWGLQAGQPGEVVRSLLPSTDAGSAGVEELADGTRVVVARRGDPNPDLPGWEAVVVRPYDQLIAGSLAVRNRLIAFGLGAGALTAAATWLGLRRSSRGLRALDRSARALRAGEPGAAMPLVDGRDDIARVSRSLRELTDHLIEQQGRLERSEAQLRSALDLQDDFVAMASHEMRTPLTVVRGTIEVLTRHGPELDAEQRGKLLAALMRQLDRLERLSEKLVLTRSLSEPGVAAPQLTSVERFRPADGLQALIDAESLDGDPDLEVVGSPALLDLVVGNLLENAERYGHPPVEVGFRLSGDGTGQMLEVTVSDHGDGVPAGSEDEVFERFTQPHRDLARTPGGTGLGLWLSRQLLSRIGGDLTYRPGTEVGAVFTARLPVQADLPPTDAAVPLTASGDRG